MLNYTNDCGASLNSVSHSCGSRSSPRWHVAVTHPRAERQAVNEIEALDFPTYLPLCRTDLRLQRNAAVPLFPRYVFVGFDPDTDPWGAIMNTRGVLTLIRHALHRPTPVPWGVVENLQERTSERGVVDDPGDALAVERIPVGATVRVTGGALAGLAGIVTRSAAERCAVLIRLMGREVTASVDQANLVAA